MYRVRKGGMSSLVCLSLLREKSLHRKKKERKVGGMNDAEEKAGKKWRRDRECLLPSPASRQETITPASTRRALTTAAAGSTGKACASMMRREKPRGKGNFSTEEKRESDKAEKKNEWRRAVKTSYRMKEEKETDTRRRQKNGMLWARASSRRPPAKICKANYLLEKLKESEVYALSAFAGERKFEFRRRFSLQWSPFIRLKTR